ncbi:MAG TPA: hypothetical protein VGI39_27705 [Polyangiaceae bacterium]|jgi:hypothetical protein
MHRSPFLALVPLAPLAVLAVDCVPPGNSTPSDAGAQPTVSKDIPASHNNRPSVNVLTTVFEDNFDRPNLPSANSPAPSASASGAAATTDAAAGDASASAASASSASFVPAPSNLGPNWLQTGNNWEIENGRLCGKMAHNHGVWLQKTLPVNARIEFDAISDALDGDLKCEAWGDGRSAATAISYTNATSYLAIFGGWKNTFHVLARINEHGTDRKEIKIDKTSDDPTEQPVTAGQVYHFKIERTDGKTVKWSVNNVDYLSYPDPAPLVGMGHDHFGFNDWEAKVCFDNVKVTPLP